MLILQLIIKIHIKTDYGNSWYDSKNDQDNLLSKWDVFFILLVFIWISHSWCFYFGIQKGGNFEIIFYLSKYSVPYDTIYNMQKISFEKNVYIYIWMILERAERGGECGMFNIPDAFFGHIFLSLHLFFYISILKLYHRWYDIVSIILLYVCTYTCIQCFGPNHALQVNRNHYNPQIF